jgi:hypothetical protein
MTETHPPARSIPIDERRVFKNKTSIPTGSCIQWVNDFNFKNGAVTRRDSVSRLDDLATAVPKPRRETFTSNLTRAKSIVR